MRVVIGSGLGRVRLLPRLLRIPCGFVFFAPLPRLAAPVPPHAAPFPCLLHHHRPINRPMLSRANYPLNASYGFPSHRSSFPACRVVGAGRIS